MSGARTRVSWQQPPSAARVAIDVARFVYQTYSPHSVLLSPSSQAMMQDYHLIDHGWGAHFIGYGLGTMVGPDLKPMKKKKLLRPYPRPHPHPRQR